VEEIAKQTSAEASQQPEAAAVPLRLPVHTAGSQTQAEVTDLGLCVKGVGGVGV